MSPQVYAVLASWESQRQRDRSAEEIRALRQTIAVERGRIALLSAACRLALEELEQGVKD